MNAPAFRKNSLIVRLKNFAKSVWFFPFMLGMLLIIFTSLGISGSSVGIYQKSLYKNKSDNSLIFGTPRGVRSDEWLVNTSLTVSQFRLGYPVINPSMGKGQDMTLVIDVPFKSWETIFKPQNLSFLILPLEQAFALKWWLIGYMLIMSVYVLVVHMFKGKYLLAAIVSLGFFFSPFIQWWYQSITLLSIAYVLFMVVLISRFFNLKSPLNMAVSAAAIAYITTCFALLFYPPFQVAAAIAGVGMLIMLLSRLEWKEFWRPRVFLLIGLCIALGLLVFSLILLQHHSTVKAYEHTVYPGSRIAVGGDLPKSGIFDWLVSNRLQDESELSVLGKNQSEAARFPLFGLVLLPYIVCLIAWLRVAKGKRLDRQVVFGSLAVLTLVILFLIRLITPWLGEIYRLIYFTHIPTIRLWIGVGIINLAALLVALKLPIENKPNARAFKTNVLVYGLVVGCLSFGGLVMLNGHFQLLGLKFIDISLLSTIMFLAVILCLANYWRLRYLGVALILSFNIYSSLVVNPLYKGLGVYKQSSIIDTIRQVDSEKEGVWVVDSSLAYGELPVIAGARSLNGVYFYPQQKLWQQFFPADSNTYNRYAHVIIKIDDHAKNHTMTLSQPDLLVITLPSCDTFLKTSNVRYVMVAGSAKDFICYKPLKTVVYPSQKFTIYRQVED